jgi:hypothetical protein
MIHPRLLKALPIPALAYYAACHPAAPLARLFCARITRYGRDHHRVLPAAERWPVTIQLCRDAVPTLPMLGIGGWRLAAGNTSRQLGQHAVLPLPQCSYVPAAERWPRVGARLRRALLLRRARRSHAPTLRSPFGERG